MLCKQFKQSLAVGKILGVYAVVFHLYLFNSASVRSRNSSTRALMVCVSFICDLSNVNSRHEDHLSIVG